MDWVGKQSVQGDVDRRNLLINGRVLKWGHSRCVPTNREVPTGRCGGDSCCTFPGKSAAEVPAEQCTQHGEQAGGMTGLCGVTGL